MQSTGFQRYDQARSFFCSVAAVATDMYCVLALKLTVVFVRPLKPKP